MSRIKTYLMTWTAMIAAYFVWSNIGAPISHWIYGCLASIGFPIPLIQLILVLLPIVLLLEIIIKLLFLKSMTGQKIIPTQADLFPHINQDELNRYTSELEQIGFIQLDDYTISPARRAIIRPFAHPYEFCFAEIYQVDNLSITCSISCHFDKNWSLEVSKANNFKLSAISYAFFRQPRKLSKKFCNTPVNLLFQSILKWREQLSNELGVEPIQDVRSETYFERQRIGIVSCKRTLLRKSVILSLLEMWRFSLNPKSEWLGDYSKFKINR